MPRNKTGKRTVKRQVSAKTTWATVQKLEKDFMEAPAKIAAQFNKEINVLKQKENKLKNAINKMKAQLKQTETRMKSAAKLNTAASKKQLQAMKKMHSETVKAHAALANQLQDITKSLENANNKQAKFSSLSKHLNQFERDWAKQSKAKKVKAAAKPKKTKAKKIVGTQPKAPEITQPHFQPMETAIDDIVLIESESTEIAS